MEDMSAVAATNFDKNCRFHPKHPRLKGLHPKTVKAYSRAIRRVGDLLRSSDRRSDRGRPDGLLHRPARDARLGFGQARSVRAQVLSRVRPEGSQGGAGSDQDAALTAAAAAMTVVCRPSGDPTQAAVYSETPADNRNPEYRFVPHRPR